MDRDTAVAEIARGLSFRRNNTGIVEEMQRAQRDLEMGKSLPWFLIDDTVVMAGVADVATVTLPDGFIQEVEDEPFGFYDDDGDFVRDLEKGELNQLRKIWTGSTRTEPYSYALLRTTLQLFPTPGADFEIRGSAYIHDEVLASNIENLWLEHAPDVIIAKAGLKMAADLLMPEAVQKFQALELRAVTALNYQNVNREIAGKTYIMGGNN